MTKRGRRLALKRTLDYMSHFSEWNHQSREERESRKVVG
jgi:hypothetical protein